MYAVIKDGVIDNVVVGENDQAGPILAAMLPDSEIVRVTEETGPAIIGGDLFDGILRPPKMHSSWIWNVDSKEWTAPVPRPNFPCFWSENAEAWIPLPPA